jgi:hypothetical protein
MYFRFWKKWFSSISIHFKWFIVLVLSRPIIDIGNKRIFGESLWNLQEITGILTYALMLISIISLPKIVFKTTALKRFVLGLGILFFASLSIYFILNPSAYTAYIFSKALFPFFLFVYLSKVIKNIEDIEGILLTALFAAIFPALMIIYEMLFGAIISHYESRGLIRYTGLYEDVFTYSFNLILPLIALIYFNLKRSMLYIKRSTIILYVVFLFAILFTFKLNHNVTTVTVFVIIIYFLKQKFKISPGLSLFSFSIFAVAVIYFFYDEFNQELMTAFGTEISAVQYNTRLGGVFHGRFERWDLFFDKWLDYPLISHLLGMPYSFSAFPSGMLSGHMHSDFVRILFTTGFLGLTIYLFWFVVGFWLSRKYVLHIKVLIRSVLIVLFLFSVTSLPLFYAPLMYIVVSAFVFAGLIEKSYRERITLLKKKFVQIKAVANSPK